MGRGMAEIGEGLKEVAIIGLGNMGGAIAKNLARRGYEIHGYDPVEMKMPKHVTLYSSLNELLAKQIPAVIAVKPSLVKEVVGQLPDNRLIISIAAGITTEQLNSFRKSSGPVIRVMPNTPFQIGEGVSALFADSSVGEGEKAYALELFQTGGDAFYIDSESKMHAVTALSGSGPAFVSLFMQAMEDAGVYLGLSRELSRKMAAKTIAGTGRLIEKSGRSPQELIQEVTSPGGTTIYGIHTLKDFSMERAVQRAIRKAADRSMELGGK